MRQTKRGGFLSPCVLIVLVGSLVVIAHAQNARVALTPPMGWEDWSYSTHEITTAATVRAEARAMATNGMKAAGYRYVVLGEGWEGSRDRHGNITSTSEFPDMRALSGYIHGLGLKFGIYSSPGPYTCNGYTGSYQHEMQDAKTFAAWGVDYLKYDWCSAGLVYRPAQMTAAYRMMHDALRSTGRPIVFGVYEFEIGGAWRWAASVGANLWGTAEEMPAAAYQVYLRMASIGFEQNGLEKYAGPGHWNDPGLLEIGTGRLMPNEEKLQMSLWSLLAAPLITGNDLRTMTQQTKSILTNREVIAVDQDPKGIEGHRVAEEGELAVWMKPLSDGTKAVGLFNREVGDARITVNFSDIGIRGAARVRDLWEHKDLGVYRGSFSASVPSHGVVMVRVTPE